MMQTAAYDDLDYEYERVVAEHRAQRVQHWRERFAAAEAQPVRKVRVFAPEPVEPAPSSLEPRYRKRLTIGQAAAANRQRKQKRSARDAELHRNRWREQHGLTGYLSMQAQYDIPAILAACKAKRGDQHPRGVANVAGISFNSYRGIESGIQRPSLPTLRKLCAWLGVEPEVYLRANLAPSARQEAR